MTLFRICAMLITLFLVAIPARIARALEPIQRSYSVVRIKMIDAKRGWAVGNRNGRDVVLRTVDGGLRFTDVTPPQLQTPFSDDFPDETDVADDFVSSREAWVASTREKGGLREIGVCHTLDGGSHWAVSRVSTYYQQDVSDLLIDFVDARHGFMLSTLELGTQQEFAKSVYRTNDEGKTWRLQASNASPNGVAWLNTLIRNYNAGRRTPGLPVFGAVTGFVFQNKSNGWLTAFTPREYDDDNSIPLYHSSDGGKHWILVGIPRPQTDQDVFIVGAFQPAFFGSGRRTGEIVVEYRDKAGRDHEVLYSTCDGGKSWKPSRRLGGSGINLIGSYDSSHFWIWDDDSKRLQFSADLGMHWKPLGHSRIAPVDYFPVEFDFASPRIGWAIFRTGLESVVAKDGTPMSAILVRTCRTVDGGNSWKLLSRIAEIMK